MAKTIIFLDTTPTLNDSKQLSKVSDQVLDKSDVQIQRKCLKTWFFGQKWQKLIIFGQNLKNENFWPSFRQIWCADSKKMSKNLIFWLNMAENGKKFDVFGQNLENENFFQKSTRNIFLASPRCNFVPSFRKIWCADLQISRRGRTDERAWFHRSFG